MNALSQPQKKLLDGKALVLSGERLADDRGSLFPLYLEEFGFRAIRLAVIHSGDGIKRGGHAHNKGSQLLVCVAGSVEVELRHKQEVERVLLKPGVNALLIHSPVWARQTYLGDSPCLVLMSDVEFNTDDYLGME